MRFLVCFLLSLLPSLGWSNPGVLKDVAWNTVKKAYPNLSAPLDELRKLSEDLFTGPIDIQRLGRERFEGTYMARLCGYLSMVHMASISDLNNLLKLEYEGVGRLERLLAHKHMNRLNTAFVDVLIQLGYARAEDQQKYLVSGKFVTCAQEMHFWFHKDQEDGEEYREIFCVLAGEKFHLVPFFSNSCLRGSKPSQKKLLFLNNTLVEEQGVLATYKAGPDETGGYITSIPSRVFPSDMPVFSYQPYTGLLGFGDFGAFNHPIERAFAISNASLGFDDVAVQAWEEAGRPSETRVFFQNPAQAEDCSTLNTLLFLEYMREVLTNQNASVEEKKAAQVCLEHLKKVVHTRGTSRKKKAGRKRVSQIRESTDVGVATIQDKDPSPSTSQEEDIVFLKTCIEDVEKDLSQDPSYIEKIRSEQDKVRRDVAANAISGRQRNFSKLSQKGKKRLEKISSTKSDVDIGEKIKEEGRIKVRSLNKLILKYIGKLFYSIPSQLVKIYKIIN